MHPKIWYECIFHESYLINKESSDQRVVAQLAAQSCGDLEITGSNPIIRWETFGLNPQARSSRISPISPKTGSEHLW